MMKKPVGRAKASRPECELSCRCSQVVRGRGATKRLPVACLVVQEVLRAGLLGMASSGLFA